MVIEPLYTFNLRWRLEKMRKKVIKAHRGMAHVPRADGADRSMRKQGPT